MTRCKKCGGIYPDGTKICGSCGGRMRTLRIPPTKKDSPEKLPENPLQEYPYTLNRPPSREPAPEHIAARNVPKCPTCGSENVKRIGKLSRLVSVKMWGAASDKLGKTMECGNCGYKW